MHATNNNNKKSNGNNTGNFFNCFVFAFLCDVLVCPQCVINRWGRAATLYSLNVCSCHSNPFHPQTSHKLIRTYFAKLIFTFAYTKQQHKFKKHHLNVGSCFATKEGKIWWGTPWLWAHKKKCFFLAAVSSKTRFSPLTSVLKYWIRNQYYLAPFHQWHNSIHGFLAILYGSITDTDLRKDI